jgi:hypothetical protein
MKEEGEDAYINPYDLTAIYLRQKVESEIERTAVKLDLLLVATKKIHVLKHEGIIVSLFLSCDPFTEADEAPNSLDKYIGFVPSITSEEIVVPNHELWCFVMNHLDRYDGIDWPKLRPEHTEDVLERKGVRIGFSPSIFDIVSDLKQFTLP